ncbi:12244_t:CDS:2 [Racocetra fulgida]|uniref:12244_t:CDS:1 n=1 Tax=Racocetra fulgida TaxID=60492 RepID=A0A9N9NCI4_9GLOM|nr:12244_t:CDS:2 [Racocetra fulgida]
MVVNIFESRLESLKLKYPEVTSYIKRQLESSKMKWARIESFNKKIHDCVKANSSLITLIKEIQDLLDREAEYAHIEEYKCQILTVGVLTISKTFFNKLDIIVNEYLMEPVVVNVRRQMHKYFYYDAYKLDISDWNSIEKVIYSNHSIF